MKRFVAFLFLAFVVFTASRCVSAQPQSGQESLQQTSPSVAYLNLYNYQIIVTKGSPASYRIRTITEEVVAPLHPIPEATLQIIYGSEGATYLTGNDGSAGFSAPAGSKIHAFKDGYSLFSFDLPGPDHPGWCTDSYAIYGHTTIIVRLPRLIGKRSLITKYIAPTGNIPVPSKRISSPKERDSLFKEIDTPTTTTTRRILRKDTLKLR